VTQVADRDVLSEVRFEIAPTRRQGESSLDRGSPNDFIADQALDMLSTVLHRTRLAETRLSTLYAGLASANSPMRPLVSGKVISA
jgi:hypothetical protein